MKAFALLALLLPAAAHAGLVINSAALPEGDGQSGKDRSGFFSTWENSGFDANASPSWCGHWYDSGSGVGSWRNVYLQISLDPLAALDSSAQLTSASLNIHVTELSGSGANLYYVTNTASATGLASQQLTSTTLLSAINSATTGWLSIDITPLLAATIDNGYDWAAFYFGYLGYSSLTFSSANDSDPSLHPYISAVTTIPEPASFALLAPLATALLLLRRRRKSHTRD